jgi:hypothetical protein
VLKEYAGSSGTLSEAGPIRVCKGCKNLGHAARIAGCPTVRVCEPFVSELCNGIAVAAVRSSAALSDLHNCRYTKQCVDYSETIDRLIRVGFTLLHDSPAT